MFKVRPQDNVVLERCLGCFQIPIRMGEKRRCALAAGAHLRNSPPSLLMIGNNYLKQLAFGARVNSPASIRQSSNSHDSECSRCVRRTMLFLKVVMVVSKSQYVWVKNGDAPKSTPSATAIRQVLLFANLDFTTYGGTARKTDPQRRTVHKIARCGRPPSAWPWRNSP